LSQILNEPESNNSKKSKKPIKLEAKGYDKTLKRDLKSKTEEMNEKIKDIDSLDDLIKEDFNPS